MMVSGVVRNARIFNFVFRLLYDSLEIESLIGNTLSLTCFSFTILAQLTTPENFTSSLALITETGAKSYFGIALDCQRCIFLTALTFIEPKYGIISRIDWLRMRGWVALSFRRESSVGDFPWREVLAYGHSKCSGADDFIRHADCIYHV